MKFYGRKAELAALENARSSERRETQRIHQQKI